MLQAVKSPGMHQARVKGSGSIIDAPNLSLPRETATTQVFPRNSAWVWLTLIGVFCYRVTLPGTIAAGGNHHLKNKDIFIRDKVKMAGGPQYSWRMRAYPFPVAPFQVDRSWAQIPRRLPVNHAVYGAAGRGLGQPQRTTVMGPPMGESPQLQPGQGEPIPNDCSCGNPVGETVQDGKTNFWTYQPSRKMFQNAAPGYKPG